MLVMVNQYHMIVDTKHVNPYGMTNVRYYMNAMSPLGTSYALGAEVIVNNGTVTMVSLEKSSGWNLENIYIYKRG